MSIQKIREKCIEVNPEIVQELGMAPDTGDVMTEERPIRLADILLAIGDVDDEYRPYTVRGSWFVFDSGAHWNLRKDSLEDQSEETIAFISKVLGV